MHTLATSPRFAVATYDALTANIAILNSAGEIIAVNRAWVRFAAPSAGKTTSARITLRCASGPRARSG